jgi:tryptophanase
MNNIKKTNGQNFEMLEMHKVKIIKKINLLNIDERLTAITNAGNNTFLLHNKDIFLNMLTDSGVNAMSDAQQAASMIADDAYAGSESFFKLEKTCQEIFGKKFLVPAHQGRACENIICKTLVKANTFALTNHHFTTTKAHVELNGGKMIELLANEGFKPESTNPFKGNVDLKKLQDFISKNKKNISFMRIEAGTNLIGGQPVSLENMIKTCELCKKNNIITILDASLLTDNLYFIKIRENKYKNMNISEITKIISKQFDIIYFSARKLGSARGGCILLDDKKILATMQDLVTLYEGFITYGGMSISELEMINIGLQEAMTMEMISHGPMSIKFLVDQLTKNGVPMITPAGGLGCHLNAMKFCDHIPKEQYRAGSLAAAIYLISGIAGMERGTISEERNPDGTDHIANMELVRLACPRRIFTKSQLEFVIDRIT